MPTKAAANRPAASFHTSVVNRYMASAVSALEGNEKKKKIRRINMYEIGMCHT